MIAKLFDVRVTVQPHRHCVPQILGEHFADASDPRTIDETEYWKESARSLTMSSGDACASASGSARIWPRTGTADINSSQSRASARSSHDLKPHSKRLPWRR